MDSAGELKKALDWVVGNGGEPPQQPASLEGVERALRAADPRVRLVAPRLLRRVIREHGGLPTFRVRVPHATNYVIGREALLQIVDPDELGGSPQDVLPEQVILLERPAYEELTREEAASLLVRYWRLLFHARVHLACERSMPTGATPPEEVRRRRERIGQTEFEEVRFVLQQEHLLLPPGDDRAVCVEFAATYLELRHFAPGLLASYFPAIEDLSAIGALLAEDLDAEALLRETKPGDTEDLDQIRSQAAAPSAVIEDDEIGVPETPAPPAEHRSSGKDTAVPHRAQGKSSHLRIARHISEGKFQRWIRRAERASAAGNVAGAAMYRARAESSAPRGRFAENRADIRRDVQRLVERLQRALDMGEDEARAWRAPLVALVHQTPRGIWTVEARLLYDLQKVCVDHERGVWTVDVVEWMLSLGRRPIKRPLPSQREVLMSKHLHSAARRLAGARLSDHQRQQLSGLLRTALERAEQRLRDHFRPWIAGVLDEIDLRPTNLPERVAKEKLVEELLDRIVDRGFLTLGDLRDAMSRNNLKQADVAQLADLLPDDPGATTMLRTVPGVPSSAPGGTGSRVPSGCASAGNTTGQAGHRAQHGRATRCFRSVGVLAGRLRSSVYRTRAGRFVAGCLTAPLRGLRVLRRGDALLRADRRLAVVLDGVYDRGEFYLRWMHRFSSLAFGTKIGRFSTKFLAVPFGGAYLILAGLDHVAEKLPWHVPELKHAAYVAVLGVFFLALIHVEAFRKGIWRGMKLAGRALRFVLIDSVRWLIRLPLVDRILHSGLVRVAFRYVLKPIVPTYLLGASPDGGDYAADLDRGRGRPVHRP